MNRKAIAAFLALALCALAFFGCAPKLPADAIGDILNNAASLGGGSSNGSPSGGGDSGSPGSPTHSSDGLQSITDIVDEWSRLSSLHEEAVNGYDNVDKMFLPLQLVGPELTLAMIAQYDLLNFNNDNGRFDGTLMLSGHPAFEERNGARIVFGSDYTVPDDGNTYSYEPGDRLVENGEADLSKAWLKSEDTVERDGKKISRTYIEVIKMGDGGMALLYLSGRVNDGDPVTDAVFLRISEGAYEYVVASSGAGEDFDILSLGNGFDKAQALSLLQGAGYTVTESGSDVNGKLVAD
ncbi:MAG: hypothetical protein ABFC62_10845 [Clostridiaceae bacterium]|nr:hypothetical protein [Eubacteriales bacterium]